MIRVAALLLLLAGAAPAAAATSLESPQGMAVQSGLVLGAAAACGVSASCIAAVRRTTFGLIRQVAFDREEIARAERHQRYVAREIRKRTKPGYCPEAVEAFEHAERN